MSVSDNAAGSYAHVSRLDDKIGLIAAGFNEAGGLCDRLPIVGGDGVGGDQAAGSLQTASLPYQLPTMASCRIALRETVLVGSTPASIRRLSHSVIILFPA